MIAQKERQAEKLPLAFKSVAVVGAAGQVGEFLTRNLSPVVSVEAVVRSRRWTDEANQTGMKFHSGIAEMLATKPEVIILATPNPANEALTEIAQHIQGPTTLILPQNGVDIASKAEAIVEDAASKITLIRASLFTNVSRDAEGNLLYNPKKKRIALATVGDGDCGSLEKSEKLFTQAGFEVRISDDYRVMEWSKLLVNLIGSTSTVTGLSPMETFGERRLFMIEQQALRDRLRILRAAGIKIDDDLWSVSGARLLARIPKFMVGRAAWGAVVRGLIAKRIASERNNQVSAAARQISEGAKKVESTDYYHKVIADLGESPVDQAIVEILERHRRPNNDFSLTSLDAETREKLLLETHDYETKPLYIKSVFWKRLIATGLYGIARSHLEIKGEKNLKPVAETLKQRRSVLVNLNHRGHADHPAIIEALEKKLPEEAKKFPFYFVSNTTFDKELLSSLLGDAFPRVVVHTVKEGANEEIRWRAKIVNRRSARVTEGLLKEPGIVIMYPEGGRSKKVVNGRVQLQEPAIGSALWIANPKFGLILPVVITGTEKMLPPGKSLPRRAKVALEFCETLDGDELRKREAHGKARETHLAREVLKVIAAKLPEDERGPYGSQTHDLDSPQKIHKESLINRIKNMFRVNKLKKDTAG